jgi:hypothetical protein
MKNNNLLKEVTEHIKTKLGFNVEEDGFSDYEGKYLVNSRNPNFRNKEGVRNPGEFMFIHHITFSVSKKSKKEQFIIWDKRVNQPFFKSTFCVYKGSFGRYEFNNKEDFYNHIKSDYGMDELEKWSSEHRGELV